MIDSKEVWAYADRAIKALPEDLIDGMCVPMHHRDFVAKFEAKKKYLGEDMLAIKLTDEFNSLPEEQKAVLAANPGKYGIHSLSDTLEVDLGLTIIAKEIFPDYILDKNKVRDLTSPEIVATVTARFPAITPERIAKVLEPVMA